MSFKALKYTLWQHHYVLAFYTRPVLILLFTTILMIIIVAWFLWVLSPGHCISFSILKVFFSLFSYMTLQDSFLPLLSLSSCKMKLIILTYLTEVSWRPINICAGLVKCKAPWATSRLGLYSKAVNPPRSLCVLHGKHSLGQTDTRLCMNAFCQILDKIMLQFMA